MKFVIVVPSQRLESRVKQSPLMEWKEVHLIYNGVDVNLFKKHDKSAMRIKHNIPSNKFVILYIADGWKRNFWKWWQYVDRIIDFFSAEKDFYFLSIGNGDRTENLLQNGKELGYVTDPIQLAEIYSLADVFVYPSLADNCPLVVEEALSCHLPVVAFSTGGIPELVLHKNNGYVAKYKNFDDLYAWIMYFFQKKNGSIENITNHQFSLEKMVDSYIKLYQSL